MAKIKLDPAPTFTAPVKIPVHGSDPAVIAFTFKHRTRTELGEWVKSTAEMTDSEVIATCASGWEFDDEFTPKNIHRLVENYGGSGLAVFNAYIDELRGARAKN
jgi:hypothetical protein